MAGERTSVWKIVAQYGQARREARQLVSELERLKQSEERVSAGADRNEAAQRRQEKALGSVVKQTKGLESVLSKVADVSKKAADQEYGLASARGRVTSATISRQRQEINLAHAEERLHKVQNSGLDLDRKVIQSERAIAQAQLRRQSAVQKLAAAEAAAVRINNDANSSDERRSRAHLAVIEATLRRQSAEEALHRAQERRRQAAQAANTLDERVARAHLSVADAALRRTSAEQRLSRAQVLLQRELAKVAASGNTTGRSLKAVSDGFRSAERSGRGLLRLFGLIKFPAVAIGIQTIVAALSALGGAAVAVVGALGPIVGLLGAIPQLAATAGQGLGALVLGFSGIGTALKGYVTQQAAAAKAGNSAAKSEFDNARRIRDAKQALRDAREREAEAAIRARENIVAANKDIERAEDNVREANRNVIRAQEDARQAQIELTQARKRAQEQLNDMRASLDDYALSEERASLSVAQARQRLQETLNDPQADALERADAELSVREAEQRLERLRNEAANARKDYADAQKKGVEGSDLVVDAQRRVRDANEQVIESQKAVAEAVEGVAEAQKNMQKTVRENAVAQRDAAQAVTNALEGVDDAYRQNGFSAAAAAAGTDKFAEAMAKLSPAGRAFVKLLLSLKPKLDALKNTAQTNLLPGVGEGLKSVATLFPIFNKGVADTSKTLGNLAASTGKMLATPMWRRDFATILGSNNDLLKIFGATFQSLLNIVRHITVAAIPFTTWLVKNVAVFADYIEKVTQTNRENGKLGAFFEKTKSVLRTVGGIVANLAQGLFNVGKAGSDLGGDLLNNLLELTKRFREFTESAQGQDRLRQYFDSLREPLSEIFKLIGSISKSFVNLGTNENIAPLIKDFREKLLPAIKQLFNTLAGGSGNSIIDTLTSLVNVLNSLAESGSALGAFLAVFRGLFEGLRFIIENVPGADKALGAFLVTLGLIKAVKFVSAITGISSLIKLSKTLGEGDGAKGLAAYRAGFVKMQQGVVKALTILRASFLANPWFLLIAGLIIVTVLIVKYWDQIKAFVAKAVKATVAIAKAVWDTLPGFITKPLTALFTWMKVYWTTWFRVMKAYFTTGIAVIKAVWGAIKAVLTDPVKAAVTFLVPLIRAALEDFKSRFRVAVASIKAVWTIIKATIVNPISDAVKNVRKILSDAITGWKVILRNAVINLGSIWDGLKGKFSAPLNYIIGTVINGGFIAALNKVLGFLKLPKVPNVPNPFARPSTSAPSQSRGRAYAEGGLVPGVGDKDTVPARLMPGEFVIRKRAVKKIGLNKLRRLNAGQVPVPEYNQGGFIKRARGVQHFEDGGGVLKTIGSGVREGLSNAAGVVTGKAGDIADFAQGVLKGFNGLMGGVSGLLNRVGDSPYGQMLKGGVNFMIDKVKGWVTKKDEEQAVLTGETFDAAGGDYGPPNYGGNAANTQAAINFIRATWGLGSGGWRPTGSVPGSDHPRGKASDTMIPNWASSSGISQGNAIANWFVQNPKKFGTKYVIWRARINQGGGWGPYSHPSGASPTLRHDDHVHVSYLNSGGFPYTSPAAANRKNAVPAMLTPGEFVLSQKAANKLGPAKLQALNNYDRISGLNYIKNSSKFAQAKKKIKIIEPSADGSLSPARGMDNRRSAFDVGGLVQHFGAGGTVDGFRPGNTGDHILSVWLNSGSGAAFSNVANAALYARMRSWIPKAATNIAATSPYIQKLSDHINLSKTGGFSEIIERSGWAREFLIQAWYTMSKYKKYGTVNADKWKKFNAEAITANNARNVWNSALDKNLGLKADNQFGADNAKLMQILVGRIQNGEQYAGTPGGGGSDDGGGVVDPEQPEKPRTIIDELNEQLRRNALNAEFIKYLELFATWGLPHLVSKLSSMGVDEGMEIARTGAKNKPKAIELDAAYKAAEGLDPSSEDTQTYLKMVGLLAGASVPIGIRDLAQSLGIADYSVVGLYNKHSDKLAKSVPAAKLSKLSSDLQKWYAGIFYAAGGGRVPGTGERDTVPAMLTPGEFVIRKKAARALGPDVLQQLNHYAEGGPVLNFAGPSSVANIKQVSSQDVVRGKGRANAGNSVVNNYNTTIKTEINNPSGENSISSFNRNLRQQGRLGRLPGNND